MSVSSWFKNLFLEQSNGQSSEVEMEKVEEVKDYDYNLKIFDVVRKSDISQVTNYIIQDKALALIKMHKFTGNKEDLKEVLNELKKTCDGSNSRIIGVTNNMYFVIKNSVNLEKENSSF